jgi:hypothetical protein
MRSLRSLHALQNNGLHGLPWAMNSSQNKDASCIRQLASLFYFLSAFFYFFTNSLSYSHLVAMQ